MKCLDSRYVRLGVGIVAHCHLLSPVGAHAGDAAGCAAACAHRGRGEQDLELGAAKLPALPLATSLTPTSENLFCGKVHLARRGKVRRKMQP